MTLYHMRVACWVTEATNMLRIGLFNNYCSPLATLVASMRLSVTFIRTSPLLLHTVMYKCMVILIVCFLILLRILIFLF